MTRIKIPECSNPFEVTVNGRKYKYEAGIETDVPDDVAKAIEKHHKAHYKEAPKTVAPFSGGATSWNDLKDKPFYEEVKLTPIAEEQTLNYVSHTSFATAQGIVPNTQILWSSYGKKTIILIDGVEYEGRINDNGDYSYVEATLDGGEEFSYYDNGQSYIGPSFEGQHTISIFLNEATIHTLDNKYVSTNFPRVEKAAIGDTLIVDALDENGMPIVWKAARSGVIKAIVTNIALPTDANSKTITIDDFVSYADSRHFTKVSIRIENNTNSTLSTLFRIYINNSQLGVTTSDKLMSRKDSIICAQIFGEGGIVTEMSNKDSLGAYVPNIFMGDCDDFCIKDIKICTADGTNFPSGARVSIKAS